MEELGNKRGFSIALHNIGLTYMNQGDYDRALNHFNRSLKIDEEFDDNEGIAITLDNIGSIYWRQGEYDQALEYYNQSLKIHEDMGNKRGIASSLVDLGKIYKSKGNYEQALDHYSRSQKINEEIGNKRGTASSLHSIGVIYQDQRDYSKALGYYSRSLNIFEELGNKGGIASTLNTIGYLYQSQSDYLQAINHYNRSLKFMEEIGYQHGLATVLNNLGALHKEQGDYIQAMTHFSRSLKIHKEMGHKKETAYTLDNIGSIFREQGNYPQAISYGERALRRVREMGDLKILQNVTRNLYKSYKATGRSASALEMHELYISTRDSLKSEENQKATIRFEFEQKALRDSLAQVEASLQQELAFQEQLHQKDQSRNAILAFGLIALILAVGFYARNRFVQRTNAQLKAAKSRAERSEAVKEQFLANMSHEIRTPMHAISGMIKILERNEHAKAQKVFLDAMHKSSDNLIVLLNDILDLSKIEAGKLDVEKIPMQPAEVMDTVEKILRYKAEEKSLSFSFEIDESVPNWVMGDPTRLNQILTNLAANAIKFTEKGSVSISLNKKNDFLLYEVRDTGIGIAEDKLLSVFDAFEQAEGSTTRRFGGTGLGLSISRQLVELMGGNIWAESKVGKGSAFFISLPLIAVEGEVTDKQSLSEEQIMEMGTALSSKRILLAEDNQFNQMIAADDLEYYAQGIQVDIVENGRLALEKTKSGEYDLILMDVQMPEMDGIEASLKIREWEQANDKAPIPIIAMTASLLKSEVNLCLEAGMDNYIPKPYEAEELVGTIASQLL
jgi:signal transduction histidine kinase/CheY-like chemotaxis protein